MADARASRDEQHFVELFSVDRSSVRAFYRHPQVGRTGRARRQAFREDLGHAFASPHDEEHLVSTVFVDLGACRHVRDTERMRL